MTTEGVRTGMYQARVYVSLKPTVNDPQGRTVLRGLHALGFEGARQVRVGRYLEVVVDAPDEAEARDAVARMCDQMLANPVIEEYRFDLEPVQVPRRS